MPLLWCSPCAHHHVLLLERVVAVEAKAFGQVSCACRALLAGLEHRKQPLQLQASKRVGEWVSGGNAVDSNGRLAYLIGHTVLWLAMDIRIVLPACQQVRPIVTAMSNPRQTKCVLYCHSPKIARLSSGVMYMVCSKLFR